MSGRIVIEFIDYVNEESVTKVAKKIQELFRSDESLKSYVDGLDKISIEGDYSYELND